MLSVDRRNYVIDTSRAYDDSPQPIGYGATISAPHMHAHALEELLPPLSRASRDEPTRPLRILDVGCGSGYLTAVFGRMVRPKVMYDERKSPLPSLSRSVPKLNDGKVFGIDVIPQLVQMSKTNMMKEDGDLIDSNTVEFAVGDGWKGYPGGSPYNAIHVGAAAATFPIELMKQLAVGGVMFVPVGPEHGEQYLYRVERVDDRGQVVGLVGSDESRGFHEEDYRIRRVLGVRYVPLVRTD
jgi:protein-L-isoaspartate(D-aspartate) O-methyltransferase